jgi:hypothetical protein
MLRLFDKAAMMNMNIPNYEYLAMKEWNSDGKGKYPKL